MKKYFREPWSDAENDLLVEYYYTLSLPELYKVLPGRAWKDILAQVALLTKANRIFNR